MLGLIFVLIFSLHIIQLLLYGQILLAIITYLLIGLLSTIAVRLERKFNSKKEILLLIFAIAPWYIYLMMRRR